MDYDFKVELIQRFGKQHLGGLKIMSLSTLICPLLMDIGALTISRRIRRLFCLRNLNGS